MILSLTSDIITRPAMYDAANSILAQKMSQISGVGQVFVGGGANPAVRAEVNPNQLNNFGIGIDAVRTALGAANANRPKGALANAANAWTINDTDQIKLADQYRPLIVGYNKTNGAAVRLGDVADVEDSVEDIHTAGVANGKQIAPNVPRVAVPAVLVIIFRQPGANIIDTVDHVYSVLPQLQAAISPAINLSVVMDRTTTVRASVHDIEITLLHFGRPGHPGGVRLLADGSLHHHSQHRRAAFADRHFRRHVPAGLQSRQSFADGTGHFYRIRGG